MRVLSALREATRNLHQETEAGMDLMKADLMPSEYLFKLRVLQAWLSGLHQHEQSQTGFASHWNAELSLRLRRIDSDLQRPASRTAPAGLPTGLDAWWGICYVLEGSMLGGQVITRHVQARVPEAPVQYFSGWGEQTGPRWRQFLAQLEAHSQAADLEAVCQGAIAAFRYLAACQKALS